jgi:Tfp pilus assembly protein PilN
MSEVNNAPIENSSENEQKDGRRNIILILIFLLLLLSVAGGFLGYQYFNNVKIIKEQTAKVVDLTKQIDEQLEELQFYKAEYEKMMLENEELQEELTQKMLEIEELEKQLLQARRSGGGGNFRAELDKLKSDLSKKNKELEELMAKNQDLEKKNSQLKKDFEVAKEEKDRLEEDNKVLKDKVDIAKMLKLSSVEAGGLRVKKNGNKNIQERAKKVNLIATCITIMENSLADTGDKNVYVVISDPKKRIISESQSNTFEYMGVKKGYTVKKTFYFNNKSTEMCLESPQMEFERGTYQVEVFIDNYLAGKTSVELN